MIGQHLRDRFFQRYGMELDKEKLQTIIRMCWKTPGRPNARPGAEEVSFLQWGHNIRVVWDRNTRFIFTFLPEPGVKLAQYQRRAR